MGPTITWHGHANFQLDFAGTTIYIDPFFTANPKADIRWEEAGKADLVLVTHMHGDHTGDAINLCKRDRALLGSIVGVGEAMVELGLPQELVLNGIGFNIGGTIEFNGIKITMTEAFHTSEAGAPCGFILSFPDGFTVYHAGDTGIFSNMKVLGELYDIDLALLPVGGVFTMDARQGALAAAFLKTKAACPIHWGTFPILEQNTDDFVRELKERAPECRPILLSPGESRTF